MNSEIRKYNKQNNALRGITGFLIFPAVHFYLLEAYTHNGWKEVRPWSQLFNVVLFELLLLLFFFLLRNLKWALRAEGIAAMLTGLVNYYVYTFRSLPLVPWDFLSIGTALSVADNYNFMPEARVVIVVIAFLAVFFLEGFFDISLKKWKWYQSLVPAAAAGIVLVFFSNVMQQEDFQNQHRMYNKLFTPVYMWQVNGFALTFVMDLPYMSVDKPQGYDKEEVQELLASYEEDEISAEQTPNIIVVMDEAFSDLSVLGDFTASEDYMPYFNSLRQGAENTVTGYLNVSVCGGNTANTEFEFLTGNTMAFLPQGSVPYQQYIKSEIPSLPSYLKELGYQTYAMHPYNAGGWDRDTVYPLLGFDNLTFLPDYQNREYIRNYVSDHTCVEKIIEVYEQKEQGKPAFIFLVTMQNHGSYGDFYDNFTPQITVEGKTSYSLSAYLSLIQKTDEALEELIAYFSEAKEPTMVVFFGDHQPNDTVAEPILELNGMTYRTLTEEETDLRYQVPYLIWSNYEMEGGTSEDTSVNYLGGKVLEKAGLPLPAYQKFLKEFSETCPILSAQRILDANGAEVERKGNEDLLSYQKIQYYQLFDVQN